MLRENKLIPFLFPHLYMWSIRNELIQPRSYIQWSQRGKLVAKRTTWGARGPVLERASAWSGCSHEWRMCVVNISIIKGNLRNFFNSEVCIKLIALGIIRCRRCIPYFRKCLWHLRWSLVVAGTLAKEWPYNEVRQN